MKFPISKIKITGKSKQNKTMNIIMKTLNVIVILTFFIYYSGNSQSSPDNWVIGTSSGILTNFSKEELDELKKNGITHLELSSGIFLTKSQEEREIWCKEFKLIADKAGIEIWSIHLPFGGAFDISLMDSVKRINAIQKNMDVIDLCKILNPEKYVIHASAEPIKKQNRKQRIKNCITSLTILNEEVKKQRSQLVVECLPRTCLGNTSSELTQIVNSVGNGIGICFDSNHLLKEKPEEFVANAGNLISTVHISDYDGIDERHWLPGKGIINWNNVIHELAKCGYQGPFLFEVSSKNIPESAASTLNSCWEELKAEYLKVKSTSN